MSSAISKNFEFQFLKQKKDWDLIKWFCHTMAKIERWVLVFSFGWNSISSFGNNQKKKEYCIQFFIMTLDTHPVDIYEYDTGLLYLFTFYQRVVSKREKQNKHFTTESYCTYVGTFEYITHKECCLRWPTCSCLYL